MRLQYRVRLGCQSLLVGILSFLAGFVVEGCSNVETPTSDSTASLTSLDGKYVYPVKPGTPQWMAFQSHEEMLAAVQLPKEVLTSITTDNLVDAVLDYPMFLDLDVYSGPDKDGMDVLVEQFNGLQELLRRADAGKVLLARFEKFDTGAIDPNWSEEERGSHSLRLRNIQALIVYNPFFVTLSERDRQAVVLKVFTDLHTQKMYPDMYGPNGETGSSMALLMSALQVDHPDAYREFQDTKLDSLAEWFNFMRGAFPVTR